MSSLAHAKTTAEPPPALKVARGWHTTRLKYVATINDEALPETTPPDREIQYVDIGNVEQIAGIVSSETMTYEDAPSRARRRVREGDVLVSTVRTYLRAIARVQDPPANLIVSTGFAVVRPRSIDPRFAAYALQESGFVEEVVSRSTGVSYPAINAPEVGNIVIPIPPAEEQRRIADFLDRKTALIDELVDKRRKLIERLREQRLALVSHVMVKGITDQTFSPSPLRTGIEAPTDWLNQGPADWTPTRIAVACEPLTNGYVGPTRDILVDDGVRYLQSLHIKAGQIKFDRPYFVESAWSNQHPRSILKEGDVLIVQTGDIGQAAVVTTEFVDANCHALILARPRPQYLIGKFLSYFLNSHFGFHELKRVQTGALHPHLNCGLVRGIRFLRPPLDQQEEIVAYLDRETARIDAMIAKVEQAIERLQEYRAALITAAVTGQIDVRVAAP